MKKAEMMNKMELDIMAMENVSGGTGPLTTCDPPKGTGPLASCDPPKGTGPLSYPWNETGPLGAVGPVNETGPLGNAVGPVKDWRR